MFNFDISMTKNKGIAEIYLDFIRFLKSLDKKKILSINPEDDLAKYIEELCKIEEHKNKQEKLMSEYKKISALVKAQSVKCSKGHFMKLLHEVI